jgi:hypothetical protein
MRSIAASGLDGLHAPWSQGAAFLGQLASMVIKVYRLCGSSRQTFHADVATRCTMNDEGSAEVKYSPESSQEGWQQIVELLSGMSAGLGLLLIVVNAHVYKIWLVAAGGLGLYSVGIAINLGVPLIRQLVFLWKRSQRGSQ